MINLRPDFADFMPEDNWKRRPKTYLGAQVEGFPNMFMVIGPHTAPGNIPRSIEYNVEWVTGIIRHMRENGLTRAECRPGGVADGTDHVRVLGEGLLSNEIDR
jgi:cation diffusion facilitator CzcD-associated flavoprotein CzcO